MLRVGGRQDERGLGVVDLARHGLHLRGRQPARVRYDEERVAGERAVREDVAGDEGDLHGRRRYRPEARPETAEADHRERAVEGAEEGIRARGEEEVLDAEPRRLDERDDTLRLSHGDVVLLLEKGHGRLEALGPVRRVRGVDREGAARPRGRPARSRGTGASTSSATCSTKSARRTTSNGPPGTVDRSRASASSNRTFGSARAARRARAAAMATGAASMPTTSATRGAKKNAVSPRAEPTSRTRVDGAGLHDPEERRVALFVLAPVSQEPVRPVHPLVVVGPVHLRVRGESFRGLAHGRAAERRIRYRNVVSDERKGRERGLDPPHSRERRDGVRVEIDAKARVEKKPPVRLGPADRDVLRELPQEEVVRLQALDVVRAVRRVEAEAAARQRGRAGTPRASPRASGRRCARRGRWRRPRRTRRPAKAERSATSDFTKRTFETPRARGRPRPASSASSEASTPTTSFACAARKKETSPRAEPSSRTRSEGAGTTTRSVSRFRSSYLRGGFVNQWLLCSPSK